MLTDRPPEPKEHLPHIVRIRSGQQLQARIAGTPIRLYTHYVNRRTHPCLSAGGGDCPLCHHVSNPRYYAYWPISGNVGLQAAVELTELAELQLLQCLPDSTSAVGTLIHFHRPGGRRNNPVEVTLPAVLPHDDEKRKTQIEKIPPFQIVKSLFRLWDCPPALRGESHETYLDRIRASLLNRYAHLVRDLGDSN